MSGDQVWVRTGDTFGMGAGQVIDGYSGATPLGQMGVAEASNFSEVTFTGITGQTLSISDMFFGFIPGSIGEVSTFAILIGAIILIVTGVGSWKTMLSVFLGGIFTVLLINIFAQNAIMEMPPLYHLILGGFAFGAVFMATDPVTAARTEKGKWIYGFLIGLMAVTIRVFNPGYPEGMMLAILFMNAFAPLIDFYVVDANIKRRLKRAVAPTTTNNNK
jgi:Na+-transporting NADH:ubiquinone oxidoreductase subunit B